MLAELPDVWADALDRLLALAPAARPRLRQPALAGGRRRLAGVARAAARLRREGDARGRRPHHLDRRPTRRYEAAVHAAVDAAFDDPAVRGGARRPASRASPGPGWSNALSAKLRRADDARACPTSTRAASCGSRAWSTPTTAARSTSTCDARCWRASSAASGPCSPARRRPRPRQAAGHPGRADACAATSRTGSRRTPVDADGDAAATTCSPSTAAARSRSPPGCRSAWPRAAGATPRCACPTGAWADLLTGREYAGDAPLHELLADLPGRAADPGGA